jgi:hypothetical protein
MCNFMVLNQLAQILDRRFANRLPCLDIPYRQSPGKAVIFEKDKELPGQLFENQANA